MLLDVATLLQYCCNILCHLCIKKILLQNASKIITKRDRFVVKKRGKILLQNASVLLQNEAGITKRVDFITKCGRYYKTRHLLQNGA